MDGLKRLGLLLSTAVVLGMGGCPSGTGGGPVISQLEGSWSGSLACTRVQTVAGAPVGTTTSTKSLSIQFDGEGKPASVIVLGYSGGADQSAVLREEGDTVTFTSTNAGFSITQVVTVGSVTRTETKTTIVLDIDHSGTGGTSTQSGTGTQTIEATLVGDAVEYQVGVSYDVTLANPALGGISLRTLETTDCSGALTRQ